MESKQLGSSFSSLDSPHFDYKEYLALFRCLAVFRQDKGLLMLMNLRKRKCKTSAKIIQVIIEQLEKKIPSVFLCPYFVKTRQQTKWPLSSSLQYGQDKNYSFESSFLLSQVLQTGPEAIQIRRFPYHVLLYTDTTLNSNILIISRISRIEPFYSLCNVIM